MALTVYNVLDESLTLSPMPVLKIILNFLTRDKSGTSEGALDDNMISLGKSKHPWMFNMNDVCGRIRRKLPTIGGGDSS